MGKKPVRMGEGKRWPMFSEGDAERGIGNGREEGVAEGRPCGEGTLTPAKKNRVVRTGKT